MRIKPESDSNYDPSTTKQSGNSSQAADNLHADAYGPVVPGTPIIDPLTLLGKADEDFQAAGFKLTGQITNEYQAAITTADVLDQKVVDEEIKAVGAQYSKIDQQVKDADSLTDKIVNSMSHLPGDQQKQISQLINELINDVQDDGARNQTIAQIKAISPEISADLEQHIMAQELTGQLRYLFAEQESPALTRIDYAQALGSTGDKTDAAIYLAKAIELDPTLAFDTKITHLAKELVLDPNENSMALKPGDRLSDSDKATAVRIEQDIFAGDLASLQKELSNFSSNPAALDPIMSYVSYYLEPSGIRVESAGAAEVDPRCVYHKSMS